MKRRKLNLKKVFFVLVVFIVIIVILYLGVRSLFLKSPDTSTDSNPIIDEEVIETGNEFSHLSYYHEDKLVQYQTYRQDNPDLSVEDIVTHVNMGIDVPFFSRDPIIVENPEDIDVLVNKVYKLPDGWEPSNLVTLSDGRQLHEEVAVAFYDLQDATAEQGFTITSASSYRSFAYQKEIHENMLITHGEEYTLQFSAKPGHSEHQTGLAIDISINGGSFTSIDADPNYETFVELLEPFGFIIRYPEGKEHLTGYAYEPWHIRYLGPDLARKVNASGLTYDEYVARLS